MISFIAAMDQQRVIGKDNELPWKLPADLKHFKDVTIGHTIIMGRNTFESIGEALPGRKSIVLTRQDFMIRTPFVEVMNSIEEVLELCNDPEQEYFVIGGSTIFEQFLPYCKRIYLTEIDHTFEGDTFFPELTSDWKLVDTYRRIKDDKNPYDMNFNIYERG